MDERQPRALTLDEVQGKAGTLPAPLSWAAMRAVVREERAEAFLRKSELYVELIDEAAANHIGRFASEHAALAYVRAATDRHGRAHVGGWALACSNESQPTLSGNALAERALTITV